MSLFSKLFSNKKRQEVPKETEEPEEAKAIEQEVTRQQTEERQKLLVGAEPVVSIGEYQVSEEEIPKQPEVEGTERKENVGNPYDPRFGYPIFEHPDWDLIEEPKDGLIHLNEVMSSFEYDYSDYALPCIIGKTEVDDTCCIDLAKMPNVLIAGSIGTGKSTLCHSMILSLLQKKHPTEMKMVLIDVKGLEFNYYNRIDKHFLAKIPDIEEAVLTDEKKAVRTLNALVIELENRVKLLKEAGCRNVIEYNEKYKARQLRPTDGHRYLPFLVVVIDDFTLLVSTMSKEASLPMQTILEAGKAVGIHAIIGTSRLTSDVYTPQMKSCIPARIAFRVNTASESRAMIDAVGANVLGECGEMMILLPGYSVMKVKGAIVTSNEIDEVTRFIERQKGYNESYELRDSEYIELCESDDDGELDPLFEEAARIVVLTQQGSTSMIQRKLKLGYNRAGHIIDQLEAAGIVGPFSNSKSREVKVSSEYALEMILRNIRENGIKL